MGPAARARPRGGGAARYRDEERERLDERRLPALPRLDVFERPAPEDRPARRRAAALRLPPLRPISE